MWTPDALSSEARPYRGTVWRVVEDQARASTMRLTDTVEEQDVLEALIEETKPPYPEGCERLHWLLATPFRYAPYPHGSRFRRAHQRDGAFYAAEAVETALAELAFYRLLFLAESPEMIAPSRAVPHTAFAVSIRTDGALDLTAPPLVRDADLWTDLTDYAPCQDLADAARAAGCGLLRYASVRDPGGGCNVAVLTPGSYAETAPHRTETWYVLAGRDAVRALRDAPVAAAVEFPARLFAADPRVRKSPPDRSGGPSR